MIQYVVKELEGKTSKITLRTEDFVEAVISVANSANPTELLERDTKSSKPAKLLGFTKGIEDD